MADKKVISSVATSMALLDQLQELADLTYLSIDMNTAQRIEAFKQTKAFFDGGLEEPEEEPKKTTKKPASK